MKPTLICAPLLFLVAACPSSEDPQFIDAPFDGRPPIDGGPNGPTHTFVTRSYNLPENGAEAQQLGLDIDDKPNDGVDNQFGMVLGSLGTLAPDLDIQTATDRAVARGESILLIAFQADFGLGDGSVAGLRTLEGTNPSPPACSSPQDQVCGAHLLGGGHFDVGLMQSERAILGTLQGGRFTGELGSIMLPLVFGGGPPAWLPLQLAKADFPLAGVDGLTGKLGGAVSQSDIDKVVMPQLANSMRITFDATCDVGGAPPDCGCVAGEAGATLAGLFDKAPTDCMITDAEVRAVISGFLTPDIDIDGNGTNDALSLGVGLDAVPGIFTLP